MNAEKFKAREHEYRQTLPKDKIAAIRLDGKAFHTFTKNFERPYDRAFMEAMDATAKALVTTQVTNAHFAYVQSDEISIFFSNHGKKKTQLFFDGKVEKIVSVTASAATGAFMRALPTESIPVFDCRAFTLEDMDEVAEYLDWRRLDARKNAVTMAASVYFTPKQLHQKSTFERTQMLQGTNHERLPDEFFHGRFIHPVKRMQKVEYTDKRTQMANSVMAERTFWESTPAIQENMKALVTRD